MKLSTMNSAPAPVGPSTVTKRQDGLSAHSRGVLLRAAERAGLAPTPLAVPPWTHRIDDDGLTLSLDPRAQEIGSGPRWRWNVTGCGAALFHARAAVAGESMRAAVTRFPEGTGSACFARLEPPVRRQGDHLDPADDPAMTDMEVTSRVRRFASGETGDVAMPRALTTYLSVASAADGVVVVQLLRRDHCQAVAALTRRSGTGETGWYGPAGSHPTSPHDERSRRTMLLLGTATDDPMAWLRVGEALERVRLILSRYGYASSPITGAVDVPEARAALRRGLGLTFQPQILLLVGRAAPVLPGPRRPLS